MRARLGLLVGAALFLAACGADDLAACWRAPAPPAEGAYVRSIEPADEGTRLSITFADGIAADVPRAPRRIVSLLPGLTEIVHALGAGDALVGVSPHCDHPASVAALPRVAPLPVAFETLRSLEPDLVLTDRTLHGGEVAAIEARGLSVLALESSRSLGHLATTFDVLARVLDTEAAREGARRFHAELERARRLARPRVPGAEPPRVLLVVEADPLYALGPGSLLDDMLRACGSVNVACDLGRASGPFAAELVVARRPDWILLAGAELSPSLRQRWAGLPALLRDGVVGIGGDEFVRAGPRTPAALVRLAAILRGTPEPGPAEAGR